MIDQNKIILMTKLEMYNKKYGNEDRKRCKYFLEDYLYIKNFKARLCYSLVILFFLVLGAVKIVVTNLIIPESLEQFMGAYVNPYILPWVIGLIVYTLISSWIYSKEYGKSQKRLKEYRKTLKALDAYESSKKGALDENR